MCFFAASAGQLEVLQWAREQGCPWDDEICAAAAAQGHLQVLQWARAQDCPWNKAVCIRAVEGNHLELLAWALGAGCACDEEVQRCAVRGPLPATRSPRALPDARLSAICVCTPLSPLLQVCHAASRTGNLEALELLRLAEHRQSTLVVSGALCGVPRTCYACCPTHARSCAAAARGTLGRASTRPTWATFTYCVGCTSTGAHGTRRRATPRQAKGS